ncbi:hypothetical protein AYO38_08720 [bacterium SCGC AG-212-C10]|nr:hypothetical protein AYO38_08720 [bacterium SCGC AG-212-C10]
MATAIDFDVTGMTCEHCVHAVTNAVQELPGVTAVTVSLEDKAAHVEGDVLDAAAIVAAIAEEGYEAVPR